MSFSEIAQYLKEFWIFLYLVFIFINRRKPIYIGWSLLFLYFFLDDSLRIHERLGFKLATFLPSEVISGVDNQSIGELLVIGTVAGLVMVILLASYKTAENLDRTISKKILILTLVLAFFGVFLDFVHSIFESGNKLFGFLEDAGELVVMSFILSFVIYTSDQLSRASSPSISE